RRGRDESRRSRGEPPLQPERIPDRECLPVVVEIRENVHLATPLLETSRPLLELALAVVAPSTTRAVVEADVGPVGGQLVSLELLHVGPVADHERGAMSAQQVVHRLDEPARVPELEAMPSRWKRGQRGRETIVVA